MSAIVLTTDGTRARVATAEDLKGFLGRHRVVACDTETDGLLWDANVRLVQFGAKHEGYAVSVSEPEGARLVVDAIKEFKGELSFHNAPFDIRRLHQIGVDPDYVWPRAANTMVMAHVLEPNELSYKLKDIAPRWLDQPEARDAQKALKERMRKHNLKSRKATYKWDWATVPRLVLATYGIIDTFLTDDLYWYCHNELTPDELRVCQREYEVAQAVAEVSYNGFRLDIPYAEEKQREWEAFMASEEEWFAKELTPFAEGADPNPNSRAQVIAYLLDKGWQPTKFTAKTKEPQVDAVALEELINDIEFVARLHEYKRVGKWKSAYVDNCLLEAAQDGRVHALYKSLGAKTGRMSCSQPPLQQLPKGGGGEIRRLFIASDGNLICSVDYNQIEMRLAGHFSRDPHIIETYKRGGDVYLDMAEFIGCTRPQGKIASLAAVYGSKGKSIARALRTDTETAVGIVDKFWDWSPALSRWCKGTEHRARGGGVVKSMWGRSLRPHVPYAAANSIIQGTAAEVMKDGLLRLAENGLIEHVVAIVHDEVVLDAPERHAEEITNRVAASLTDDRFTIPLTTEGKVYGKSWGDGYSQ